MAISLAEQIGFEPPNGDPRVCFRWVHDVLTADLAAHWWLDSGAPDGSLVRVGRSTRHRHGLLPT